MIFNIFLIIFSFFIGFFVCIEFLHISRNLTIAPLNHKGCLMLGLKPCSHCTIPSNRDKPHENCENRCTYYKKWRILNEITRK